MSWFFAHTSGDVAYVSLRDEIGFSTGEVSDLLAQTSAARDIQLTVDSSGGCAFTAEEICKAWRGRVSLATVTGTCASAAVMITHLARHVPILPNAHMMVHGPRAWNFSGTPDLDVVAKRLREIEAALIDSLSKRTSDAEAVRTWITSGKDFWFDADAAWHAGLASEIWTPAPIQDTEDIGGESSQESISQPAIERGNSKMFLRLLEAHGPVKTSNPDKLMRELIAWGKMNIKTL